MNDPNPYQSPGTDLNELREKHKAHAPTLRAVRVSWYAMFAAVGILLLQTSMPDGRHGTGDVRVLLPLLFFFTVIASFASGLIGVIRGFQSGAHRTALRGVIPLLITGGLLAMFVWVANRYG